MKSSLQLSTRIVTAIIYVAVMILFIVPGLWVPIIPIILFAAVAFMTAYEKAQATRLRMGGINARFVAVASVVLGLLSLTGLLKGTFWRGVTSIGDSAMNVVVAPRIMGLCLLFLFIVLSLASLWRMRQKGPEELPFVVAESTIVVTSALPLASVIAMLYGTSLGWHWLALSVLTAWISDTFAFFVGSWLGKSKCAVRLSPSKTWEGFLGGMLGTIILYMIYFPLVIGRRMGYSTGSSIAFAILAAVLMSCVSAFGDLLSSGVKRWCGIKDFGTLLPGHGGVSDRFDSMQLTQPTMLLLAMLAHLFIA